MNSDTIVVWILVINTIISLCYLGYGFFTRRKPITKYVLITIILILCPVFGLVFFVVGNFLFNIFNDKDIDLAEITFKKEQSNIVLPPDVDKEINMVPVEEALEVSDKSTLRTLMLNVLKGDTQRAMSSIAMALDSKDSETSHYAASYIMDAISEFKSTMQNMLSALKKDPEDRELNVLCLDYLNQVLHQNILSDIEKESYIYTLVEVGENMFKYHLPFMRGAHYLWLVDLLISIGDYNEADRWAKRALTHRPDDLESYQCNLELYYATQNKEAFFACLEDLKASSVAIDHQTLELIRIYSEG